MIAKPRVLRRYKTMIAGQKVTVTRYEEAAREAGTAAMMLDDDVVYKEPTPDVELDLTEVPGSEEAMRAEAAAEAAALQLADTDETNLNDEDTDGQD